MALKLDTILLELALTPTTLATTHHQHLSQLTDLSQLILQLDHHSLHIPQLEHHSPHILLLEPLSLHTPQLEPHSLLTPQQDLFHLPLPTPQQLLLRNQAINILFQAYHLCMAFMCLIKENLD